MNMTASTPRPATRPSPSPARRQRLLDAAEVLFSTQGFRAVSMARIAAAGGFAKATAYAYFADKDEIFRALAESLAERVRLGFDAALAAPGGTAEKLVRALSGKDVLIFRLVAGSPFAGELFAARDRLARDVFDALDQDILARVTVTLGDGVDRGLAPADFARILVRASRGLAARAEHSEALAADIRVLVTRLVGTEGR